MCTDFTAQGKSFHPHSFTHLLELSQVHSYIQYTVLTLNIPSSPFQALVKEMKRKVH